MDEGKPAQANTPAELAKAASTLLAASTAIAQYAQTALGSAIQRAYLAVSTDLSLIEKLKTAGTPIAYTSYITTQQHDKIAALIYLARQKFLETSLPPPHPREIADARRDLALILEVLFHLQVAEGLGLLFDYTQTPLPGEPQYWHGAAVHCLYLLAMLPTARPWLFTFLKERAAAWHIVEQMMAVNDPKVAGVFRALGEAYVAARKTGGIPDQLPQPTPTALIYMQFSQELPPAENIGYSALLAANARLQQIAGEGDIDTLLAWIAEGSPAAAGLAFHAAWATMTPRQYITILDRVLHQESLEFSRIAAAIFEIGSVNRANNPEGGNPELNGLLCELTGTDDGLRVGLARLAVRELRTVNAHNELLDIVERVPYIEVAAEALTALRDMRRLGQAETIVRKRPLLQPAYEEEKKFLQNISNLEAVCWTCQDPDIARSYALRLVEMGGIPELEKLSKKNSAMGEQAKQVLDELRLTSK